MIWDLKKIRSLCNLCNLWICVLLPPVWNYLCSNFYLILKHWNFSFVSLFFFNLLSYVHSSSARELLIGIATCLSRSTLTFDAEGLNPHVSGVDPEHFSSKISPLFFLPSPPVMYTSVKFSKATMR